MWFLYTPAQYGLCCSSDAFVCMSSVETTLSKRSECCVPSPSIQTTSGRVSPLCGVLICVTRQPRSTTLDRSRPWAIVAIACTHDCAPLVKRCHPRPGRVKLPSGVSTSGQRHEERDQVTDERLVHRRGAVAVDDAQVRPEEVVDPVLLVLRGAVAGRRSRSSPCTLLPAQPRNAAVSRNSWKRCELARICGE